jgi:hypothetical protein
MTHSFFIEGEPVLSGGAGQEEWQSEIRRRAPRRVAHPKLTFVVSGLKRRGQYFDLDNLVHPVLMVFDDPIDEVSARLYVGDRPGLLVENAISDPPRDGYLRSMYVVPHSDGSVRDRPGITEILDDPVYDEHEGIGVSLVFDRRDVPIRRGWFGPTEAVIDDLAPWLGRYTKRQLIADHRIRDLRLSRGRNPGGEGVHIAIWYVPDDAIPVPDTVTAMIADGELKNSE